MLELTFDIRVSLTMAVPTKKNVIDMVNLETDDVLAL
jgi:hypothetical protein